MSTKKETKVGGEKLLTDKEKAALEAQGTTPPATGEGEKQLTDEEKAALENKEEKSEVKGAAKDSRALEIMEKFGVNQVFETEDGQFFLVENLALLHVGHNRKKVVTHERKITV